jgi:hypothetical protein
MSQSTTPAAQRVACPFCAEEIMPRAVKCPFCAEWLTPSPAGQDEGERADKRDDFARAVATGTRADRHREEHFVMKILGLAAIFVLILWLIGGIDGMVVGLVVFVAGFVKVRKDYYKQG